MKIGTDQRISTCRTEGYVVLETKGLVDRKTKRLRKDHPVNLTISNPEHWSDHGSPLPPLNGETRNLYDVDAYVTWDEVWKMFEKAGDSIKDFCDWKNCPIETENPTVFDFAHLCQTVFGYYGSSVFH